MALTDEQRERIRAYARALQNQSDPPTQPLPPPSVPPPQPGVTPGGPTVPLRTPVPNEPGDTPAPVPAPVPAPTPNQPNKGKVVLRTVVRHLGTWDSHLGGKIPTPGGLGWLVFALVFILFAVVSYSGYSRLQWIWFALTGAATLPGGSSSSRTGTAADSATQQNPAVGAGIAAGTGLPVPVGQGIAAGLGLPAIPRQLVP